MDTAIISAFSALAGSIVGGVTSGVTTWMGHQSQTRAGHRLHNVKQREELYRDFIIAASATFGTATIKSEPEMHEIVILYGMISRMRVVSSAEVVACAEKTVYLIIDTYFAPKKTIGEIRDLIKSGKAADPLRDFSEVAREELRAL